MNTENNKTDKPHIFVFDLPKSLHLRTLTKQVALQNLSNYFTWKNIR